MAFRKGIRAGELRAVVEFQARSTAQDGTGDQSTTWTTYHTTRAAVEPLSGRELFAAQERLGRTPTRITCRWFAGVMPEHRVVWRSMGKVFDLKSAGAANGIRHVLEIFADELVGVAP